MNEREQRIRWLRGQIQAMLLRGDDIECLPYAEELERLEAGEGDDSA